MFEEVAQGPAERFEQALAGIADVVKPYQNRQADLSTCFLTSDNPATHRFYAGLPAGQIRPNSRHIHMA